MHYVHRMLMVFTLMVVAALTACQEQPKTESTVERTEKITLLLDWFVNPNHATIILAQEKGYFKAQGLEVEIVEPADPSLPPKLVAAGKADIAVDYQPQLQQSVAQGLPLVRIGTLLDTPLSSLVVLKSSGIRQISDLKGKKIGYSVSGFEEALLKTMLKSGGLELKDVQLVNVNWALSPSLLNGQAAAVIGAFRNFELNQLALEKNEGFAFYPEEHGVPAYDELIFVANKAQLNEVKLQKFMTAIQQATDDLTHNPDAAWTKFVAYKPNELDNELNRLAWKDTLPHFAKNPKALNVARYQQMADFLHQQNLTGVLPAVDEYTVEFK